MKYVFLVGSTQTKHIAKLLEENQISCIDMNMDEVRKMNGAIRKIFAILMVLKSDIVYCIGGTYRRNKATLVAKILRKKTVMHWIGTDVLHAMEAAKKGIKFQKNDIELAGSELLVDELERIGIKAHKVPIVPFQFEISLKKMPEKHAILVYLPEGREEFYGGKIIKVLIEKEPTTFFHIVANRGIEGWDYKNIKFHGFLNKEEMERLYEEITILLRYPDHDGMSLMVIEALGMGKSVLYKYKHPYVETPHSDNIGDIYETFKGMLDKPVRVNREGHDFVKKYYSSENVMELYKKYHIFE